MRQWLDHVLLHLVFSTKNRAPCLGAPIRPALHAYLATVPDTLVAIARGSLTSRSRAPGSVATVFSRRPNNLEALVAYIDNQEEHHRTRIQDEFRAFVSKYGVALDERYVWG